MSSVSMERSYACTDRKGREWIQEGGKKRGMREEIRGNLGEKGVKEGGRKGREMQEGKTDGETNYEGREGGIKEGSKGERKRRTERHRIVQCNAMCCSVLYCSMV